MTAAAPLGQTLMAGAAETPLARIEQLVHERYGYTVRAERLGAERDEIFRIRDVGGQTFILKVTNALEDPVATDFQTQALLHIARVDPQLPTPRLVMTTKGEVAFRAPWGEDAAPTVRLFTYLAGQPLHAARRSLAQSAALGAVLAHMGLALEHFRHPGDARDLDWDLRHLARLAPLLDAVEDPGRRALAERYLTAFKDNVEPRLPELRWQVVHNDLNPHNVFVAEGEPDRVVGIIDFGDIVRTPLINDVAIGACYLLRQGDQPLDHPLAFVSAYHQVRRLEPLELDLLYDLMASRLVAAVAISEWRARRNPANRAYITKNTATAWDGLERLAKLERLRALDLFRRTCSKEIT